MDKRQPIHIVISHEAALKIVTEHMNQAINSYRSADKCHQISVTITADDKVESNKQHLLRTLSDYVTDVEGICVYWSHQCGHGGLVGAMSEEIKIQLKKMKTLLRDCQQL